MGEHFSIPLFSIQFKAGPLGKKGINHRANCALIRAPCCRVCVNRIRFRMALKNALAPTIN